MNLSLALSIVASATHLVAFALYNMQMKDPDFKPNTATWTLWAVITAMNASAYFHASGDLVKSILPAASSVACILTFLFTLVRGKFGGLSLIDGASLTIGLIAGLAWWHFQSAVYANMLLQCAVAVSFIPTYRSVWNVPSSEKAPPWALWGLAYVVLTFVVYMRSSGQWTDYVHPVQGALMHAAVVPLTWRKK